MIHFIINLVKEAKIAIEKSRDINTLELVRIKFVGKKGILTQQIKKLHNLDSINRPAIGAVINQAKKELNEALIEHKNKLEKQVLSNKSQIFNKIDVSLPGRRIENGGLHPISRTILRIEYLFNQLGFSISNGPEIEDDYHNFEALNIPLNHPARANSDTFWFDTTRLLRTQTSSVQIRTMKKQSPPIRIIAHGRVYRKDYDRTHTPMFHQLEGLIIDTDINFTNLKYTLHAFLNSFFEKELKIRFRPSYFPFTEPSAEVDIMEKNNNWLEILGCGMVHPNVLLNVGINPEIYSGFAFGMGIERLTMLRYDITDLRIFFKNNLRFLKQFK